jgi:hypothetical protein
MSDPRTKSEISNGLKWRAQNLRTSAADYLSRARELEKCAEEILAEVPKESSLTSGKGNP